MPESSFQQFETNARAQGFDEVLQRDWAPGVVTGTHSHRFDVSAQVQHGEFWLTVADNTRHLQAGDEFTLARDVPHAERYGAEGACVWVARRNPA